MKNRTQIDAADLYVLLQREFRRRQPRECEHCFVQLPFRVDRQDESAANWELIMPRPCARGCAPVLEELTLEFGLLYDLKPSG